MSCYSFKIHDLYLIFYDERCVAIFTASGGRDYPQLPSKLPQLRLQWQVLPQLRIRVRMEADRHMCECKHYPQLRYLRPQEWVPGVPAHLRLQNGACEKEYSGCLVKNISEQ